MTGLGQKRTLVNVRFCTMCGHSPWAPAGVDYDRILARLRALRSDLIDPTIAVHNGRVVKRTGDESLTEFRW